MTVQENESWLQQFIYTIYLMLLFLCACLIGKFSESNLFMTTELKFFVVGAWEVLRRSQLVNTNTHPVFRSL